MRLASRAGLFQTGVILVFAGVGSLPGEVAPSAVLTFRFPAAVNPLDLHQVADVTGDGVQDVISSDAYVAGVRDTHALYLFSVTQGGAAAGTTMLRGPGAQAGDRLGH